MTIAEGHAHPAAADSHAGGGYAHPVSSTGEKHVEGQQHPIAIYFKIWGLLFVLSTASYLVDYFHFQGYLRWFLFLTFMILKAGLIVAVFMHMVWERLAMMYAILVPPLLLMVLLGIGALEAKYTFFTRGEFFGPTAETAPHPPPSQTNKADTEHK